MVFVPASFEHQFRTDIRRGGSFDVTRGGVGVGIHTALSPEMDLRLQFSFGLDDYDFHGSGNFGEGWDDIHTLNMLARLSAQLTSEWALFGGPVFQFARESGASWEDSFIGGGFIGARYEHSDRLSIGGGLGVVSQLENSARFFPVVVLDWKITDLLTLSSSTSATASGEVGVELTYQFAEGWEAGIGVASRFHRFRLDKGGDVPEGIGQDTSIPIWGRLAYTFNENFAACVYVGVNADGELRLEDRNGRRVARERYDAAPVVGISGALRF